MVSYLLQYTFKVIPIFWHHRKTSRDPTRTCDNHLLTALLICRRWGGQSGCTYGSPWHKLQKNNAQSKQKLFAIQLHSICRVLDISCCFFIKLFRLQLYCTDSCAFKGFFGQSDYDCCVSHVTVEIMGMCTSKPKEDVETKQYEKSGASSESRPNVKNIFVIFSAYMHI